MKIIFGIYTSRKYGIIFLGYVKQIRFKNFKEVSFLAHLILPPPPQKKKISLLLYYFSLRQGIQFDLFWVKSILFFLEGKGYKRVFNLSSLNI